MMKRVAFTKLMYCLEMHTIHVAKNNSPYSDYVSLCQLDNINKFGVIEFVFLELFPYSISVEIVPLKLLRWQDFASTFSKFSWRGMIPNLPVDSGHDFTGGLQILFLVRYKM